MLFSFYLNLGGTLGLFTGMSIMSMIEIVFWTSKYILNFLKILISAPKNLRMYFKTLRDDNPV